MYHDDLFAHYDNYGETYKKFWQDQKRDTQLYKWSGIIGISALGVAAAWPEYKIAGIWIGAVCTFQAMVYFVDISNRNSMLHLLDYLRWQKNNPNG